MNAGERDSVRLVRKEGGEKKESACEEECESESNPKPRPQPKPSSLDVAERGVASIGVRSSGNLQGKEAALTHTNGHTGRARVASTVL